MDKQEKPTEIESAYNFGLPLGITNISRHHIVCLLYTSDAADEVVPVYVSGVAGSL